MKVLAHLGSNFPERDGGAIIVKTHGSVWLFHTEGSTPGDSQMEVEAFELGEERGHKTFVARVAKQLGFADDPADAVQELAEEMGDDVRDVRKLASSVDGRARIIMRLGEVGWWADLDDDPSYVTYEHIKNTWIAVPKGQRKFSFAGVGVGGYSRAMAR